MIKVLLILLLLILGGALIAWRPIRVRIRWATRRRKRHLKKVIGQKVASSREPVVRWMKANTGVFVVAVVVALIAWQIHPFYPATTGIVQPASGFLVLFLVVAVMALIGFALFRQRGRKNPSSEHADEQETHPKLHTEPERKVVIHHVETEHHDSHSSSGGGCAKSLFYLALTAAVVVGIIWVVENGGITLSPTPVPIATARTRAPTAEMPSVVYDTNPGDYCHPGEMPSDTPALEAGPEWSAPQAARQDNVAFCHAAVDPTRMYFMKCIPFGGGEPVSCDGLHGSAYIVRSMDDEPVQYYVWYEAVKRLS